MRTKISFHIFWKFKWRIGYGKYTSLSKINRQWRKWRALANTLGGLWCLTPLSTIFQLYCGVSFIGGGNWKTWRKPQTCRKSPTNFIQMLYWIHFAWAGFELTTLVVIGTDCTGSWKSNYHNMITITTTMTPIR